MIMAIFIIVGVLFLSLPLRHGIWLFFHNINHNKKLKELDDKWNKVITGELKAYEAWPNRYDHNEELLPGLDGIKNIKKYRKQF